MRSTPPPENIDCASLLACLASSPVGRPPDSADSHVGCRITMSVTQRRYSAATAPPVDIEDDLTIRCEFLIM